LFAEFLLLFQLRSELGYATMRLLNLCLQLLLLLLLRQQLLRLLLKLLQSCLQGQLWHLLLIGQRSKALLRKNLLIRLKTHQEKKPIRINLDVMHE